MSKRLMPALLLAAALAGAAEAQGPSRFDGQYVGRLTLDKVLSGDCTRPPAGALYPMTVAGGRVEFKYVPRFDTILRGTVAADGTFEAVQRVRGGTVRMAGRLEANRVHATIRSPSCIYSYKTDY